MLRCAMQAVVKVGRGWSKKDNDDVLLRVVRWLPHGALGRDRGRSWQEEHRLRDPGRHPPSRRPSAYQKQRGEEIENTLVATTIIDTANRGGR